MCIKVERNSSQIQKGLARCYGKMWNISKGSVIGHYVVI